MNREAIFSDDGKYRYVLSRDWSEGNDYGGRACVFIMLNPSTADADHDDPTIRRCLGFAQAWGYQRLVVLNLFAFRATDPRELKAAPDPYGGTENARHILEEVAPMSGDVVCAWGNHGAYRDAGPHMIDMLTHKGVLLRALGLTRSGHPMHPLYRPASSTPPYTLDDLRAVMRHG